MEEARCRGGGGIVAEAVGGGVADEGDGGHSCAIGNNIQVNGGENPRADTADRRGAGEAGLSVLDIGGADGWKCSRLVELAESWIVSRRGYGLRDGGCLAFARALETVIPGSRVSTILRDGRPDHHGVLLPDGRGADADGIYQGADEWVSGFWRRELIPRGSTLAVVPELVPSIEVPDIAEDSSTLAEIISGLATGRMTRGLKRAEAAGRKRGGGSAQLSRSM